MLAYLTLGNNPQNDRYCGNQQDGLMLSTEVYQQTNSPIPLILLYTAYLKEQRVELLKRLGMCETTDEASCYPFEALIWLLMRVLVPVISA